MYEYSNKCDYLIYAAINNRAIQIESESNSLIGYFMVFSETNPDYMIAPFTTSYCYTRLKSGAITISFPSNNSIKINLPMNIMIMYIHTKFPSTWSYKPIN